MEFFNENTMALFRKQLSQPIQLQGAWHMALTLLFFPSNNKKVNSGEIIVYNSRTENDASLNRSRKLRKI